MIETAIAALRVGPPAVAGPLAVFPVHGDGAAWSSARSRRPPRWVRP